MLTGKLVDLADDTKRDVAGAFQRLVGRAGEPVIRLAVRQAMRIMGHQFVMGRTIDEALSRSRKGDNANYRYSFDMLGEGALTTQDAERYLEAYRAGDPRDRQHAGRSPTCSPRPASRSSCPRCTRATSTPSARACWPNWRRGLLELAQLAKAHGIGLTIDAEEADRLELSLDLIAGCSPTPRCDGWDGFGLGRAGLPEARAVRDRLPRAPGPQGSAGACRCDWSRAPTGTPRSSARRSRARPAIRCSPASRTPTSVYLACARACSMPATRSTRCSPPTTRRPSPRCIGWRARCATAATSSSRSCTAWATTSTPKSSRRTASTCPAACTRRSARTKTCCRTWCAACWRTAPTPASSTASPTKRCRSTTWSATRSKRSPLRSDPASAHPAAGRSLPQPTASTNNSMGAQPRQRRRAARTRRRHQQRRRRPAGRAAPLVPGANADGDSIAVTNPADRREVVGQWQAADSATVERALQNAVAAHAGWDRHAGRRARRDPRTRRRPAGSAHARATWRCARKEAGKTLPDGIAEVREAVDFLRYYALQAREHFGARTRCPARPANPTSCSCTAAACSSASARGTSRWRSSSARSPPRWPPATRVIAKPAEQTNLIGHAAVQAAARSRRPAGRAAVPARRRRHRRRGADPRPARGRRLLHRLHRNRAR